MIVGKTAQKTLIRRKRQVRVRKKVQGTPERPRLNVFRSANHIYAQLIDDSRGVTVAAASSLTEGVIQDVCTPVTRLLLLWWVQPLLKLHVQKAFNRLSLTGTVFFTMVGFRLLQMLQGKLDLTFSFHAPREVGSEQD